MMPSREAEIWRYSVKKGYLLFLKSEVLVAFLYPPCQHPRNSY